VFSISALSLRDRIAPPSWASSPSRCPTSCRASPQRPAKIRWLGEGVSAQNEEIFRDLLGLKDNDIRQMRDDGII